MTDTIAEVMKAELPSLRAMARGMCRNISDQEDLIQNTLISAFRSWSSFDPSRGSYAAWLHVMMRSRAIDMHRSEKVRTEATSVVSTQACDTYLHIDDEALDQARLNTALHAFLLELPEEQRVTLKLYFFEELSDGEISRTLGIPLGTIKSRIRLGLRALRRKFGLE